MNFKPLGKRILVERLEEDTKTSSGIIIPDNAKEKPLSAKVIAISDGCNEVSVGEIVVFGKYKGDEIKLDGKEYIVLDIEDVLGIIK
ncbi:co-chaperone GroES [Helicobacter cholecystus]|uniref:Co-chaperonin GroES n=1 Tax=Helicobacter cholecystus TaxID=45498 RepID=A0A3D8IZA9_9HELI|nr:co-chaperone GroES [Helicobacter cholecystus]RDU69891.1 co-chaperone GroES [Helicobacter cholecystus]VEJ25077.1 molecular chaperone GroES [Helicobacter cholecystus]